MLRENELMAWNVATGTAFYVDNCGSLVDEILDDKWAPREETVGGDLW
jgi:hypothetical protein